MKKHAHKIGAVIYLLWGVIHILGGGLIMLASEPAQQLGMMSSNVTVEPLPPGSAGLVHAGLSFHGFNLLWFGIFVAVVAMTMNWKNTRGGYWLNLTVVGAADLGLIIFLILPGYMSVSDGLIGPLLLVPAFVFSTIGLLQPKKNLVI